MHLFVQISLKFEALGFRHFFSTLDPNITQTFYLTFVFLFTYVFDQFRPQSEQKPGPQPVGCQLPKILPNSLSFLRITMKL